MDVRPHAPRITSIRAGTHQISNGPISEAELESTLRTSRRASHLHSHRMSQSHMMSRHHGLMYGHDVAVPHPHVQHFYLVVEQNVPAPMPPPDVTATVQVPDGPVPLDTISGPPTDMSASATTAVNTTPAYQQITPTSHTNQLQLAHQNAITQPDALTTNAQAAAPAVPGADTSGMAMYSYLQQGTLFGGVATLSSEVLQLGMAVRRGESVSLETHGPQVANNVARGSLLGAAGAGLACLCGPVAPTAIFVGYGVGHEWSKINDGLQKKQIKTREATSRATKVLFGAAGGVSAAWGTATLLVGASGVATAAAAGACALAGSVAGQHFGELLVGYLPETEDERRLIAAYAELGLEPNCSDKELRQAFIRAAKSFHPDRLGPRVPGSHERFAIRSAAMDRIRAERCRAGLRASRRLSRLLPLDNAGKVRLTSRGSGAPPSEVRQCSFVADNYF